MINISNGLLIIAVLIEIRFFGLAHEQCNYILRTYLHAKLAKIRSDIQINFCGYYFELQFVIR